MIVRILPGKILEHWNVISHAVRNSLPPTYCGDPDAMFHRVQEALITDALQCWVLGGKNGSGDEVHALAVTQILDDPLGGGRELLIFSLYGFTALPPGLLDEAVQTARQYAKFRECSRITFYTGNPQLAHVVERYGAEAPRYYVSIPVEREADGNGR